MTLKVLIISGFMETEINAFREIQYSRILSQQGAVVTVFTSNESYIWKHNRAKLLPTTPEKNDQALKQEFAIDIIRKSPFFRLGDFILLPPPLKKIKEADIVHIIEFRQGHSVLAAILAFLCRKPVVYDHEQRGDRHYTALHSIDSVFRRGLIHLGSLFVDAVRHTVHANGRHYTKNALKRPKILQLAPLAADERVFNYNTDIRQQTRAKLGVSKDERLAVITGKITPTKRIPEAVSALVENGFRVVVIGSIQDKELRELEAFPKELIKLIPHSPPDDINRFYNAADIALFTTFTVSYWEALATGLHIIIPNTSFSFDAINSKDCTLFGTEEMFLVSEEQYDPSFDLKAAISIALSKLPPMPSSERVTRQAYQWPHKANELIQLYRKLIKNRK